MTHTLLRLEKVNRVELSRKNCLYLLLHCRVSDIEKVTMTTSEKKKKDRDGRKKIIRQIDLKIWVR